LSGDCAAGALFEFAAPSGWIIGRWISLAALLIYIAVVIWWLLYARQSN